MTHAPKKGLTWKELRTQIRAALDAAHLPPDQEIHYLDVVAGEHVEVARDKGLVGIQSRKSDEPETLPDV